VSTNRTEATVALFRWMAVVPVACIIQLVLSLVLTQVVNSMPTGPTSRAAAVIDVWAFCALGLAAFAGGAVVSSRRVLAAALGGSVILLIQVLSLLSMEKGSEAQDSGSVVTLLAGAGGVLGASVLWSVLERQQRKHASGVMTKESEQE
jgi:hypothetical protein